MYEASTGTFLYLKQIKVRKKSEPGTKKSRNVGKYSTFAVKALNFHIWTGVIGIEFPNQISGKTSLVIKIKLEAFVSFGIFLGIFGFRKSGSI